ncbi:hypothetical protein PTTW11_08461 [Pyrenophora teres f. teres]|uniref:N-acetyltransferase domain-containing protein n=1 Tax=Pyrenophora teres f. teres TaxID=97479 RepID=A0A6S6W9M1_9PLEO|nr:hypothetical protein HRS9122_06013 [Pyrenophora teres f. teres]KAE8859991.1 hypothetical protein PTNB29_07222 [Pyrenophora teres f. teres]CAE7199445.1 hypothetical protein PTTW11_08461 [Pyrenophora teres f. teres]
MYNQQRTPIPHTEVAEDIFETPSSTSTAEYRIRSEANQLLEDPDVEDDVVYRITPGSKVTQSLLETCAKQFLSEYGAWSGIAALKAKCLPVGANNILVTAVAKDRKHIGHCFASQWMHLGQRIWWITQLLVVNGYRNQKRATRMLKVLTKHYDIGKLDSQTDYVGVVSAHPYTICAVLRVFGRGIENLPSKPDWEKRWESVVPLVPFPTPVCEYIMGTAPFKYLNTATILPGTLTARTNFYLDSRVSKEAVERIVHSMNRQIVEPWEWLFGSLEQGCEYVCGLDYRYDPKYNLVPKTCDALDSKGNLVDDGAVNSSESSLSRHTDATTHFDDSSPSIPYADIDRYLFDVPFRCVLEPYLSRAHANLVGTKRKRIHEAKELIAEQRSMLSVIMGGKQIPPCLREAYRAKTKKYPLPEHMKSWAAFTEYMYECFPTDINVTARVLILQAIHFKELLDKHEKVEENRGKKLVKEEIRRSLKPGDRLENSKPTPNVHKRRNPSKATSKIQKNTSKNIPRTKNTLSSTSNSRASASKSIYNHHTKTPFNIHVNVHNTSANILQTQHDSGRQTTNNISQNTRKPPHTASVPENSSFTYTICPYVANSNNNNTSANTPLNHPLHFNACNNSAPAVPPQHPQLLAPLHHISAAFLPLRLIPINPSFFLVSHPTLHGTHERLHTTTVQNNQPPTLLS